MFFFLAYFTLYNQLQLVLEKAEEQEIKLPTSTAAAKSLQLCPTLCNPIDIRWIIEKAREFQKNIYFCFIDYAFDCVDHNKLKNSERWKYQTTWPASWETYMQVRKQQLELDMEQQTGSK